MCSSDLVVRYVGLVLIVALTSVIFVLAVFGRVESIPTLVTLYVPLAGLILYKSVKDAAKNEKSGDQ